MNKYWCVLLLLFCTIDSFSQRQLDDSLLKKLVQVQMYHCDSELHQFDNYLLHSDYPMKLSGCSIRKEGDSIFLQGRVLDFISEGMPCHIYLAEIAAPSCHMLRLLATANLNGHFELSLPNDPHKCLYFVSLGYHDASIPIVALQAISP